MIYLDSTYIVKCYVNELGTQEVLRLVQSHPGRGSCLHDDEDKRLLYG